jgi:hypothetical protein
VLLETKRDGAPEWFAIEYEKLLFFCLSCGVMGHSHLECDKPVVRKEDGKLPYDVKLRVFDPNKKKLQSFSKAAAEAYGSGSLWTSKQSRGSATRSGDGPSENLKRTSVFEEEEVTSPHKVNPSSEKRVALAATNVSRLLFQARKEEGQKKQMKRKSKVSSSHTTPDLNLPVGDETSLVPRGLVSTRVNQIDGEADGAGTVTSDELTKKQKRSNTQTKGGSAAAAGGSPRRAQ